MGDDVQAWKRRAKILTVLPVGIGFIRSHLFATKMAGLCCSRTYSASCLSTLLIFVEASKEQHHVGPWLERSARWVL